MLPHAAPFNIYVEQTKLDAGLPQLGLLLGAACWATTTAAGKQQQKLKVLEGLARTAIWKENASGGHYNVCQAHVSSMHVRFLARSGG